MKNLTLIIFAIICCSTYSCKKAKLKKQAEKYTGEFVLIITSVSKINPSSVPSLRSITTKTDTQTVTITCEKGDLIEMRESGEKYQALIFRYESGSIGKYGVDDNGKFYLNRGPNVTIAGGFIDENTLLFTMSEYHTTSSASAEVKGYRK